MMVVDTLKGYYITKDGGKTWTLAAPFFLLPGGSHSKPVATAPATSAYRYRGADGFLGWDAKRSIIYAHNPKGDAWKLVLSPASAAGAGKADKK